MAVADAETIGRRDRGADPGLGVAHRGFQRLAFRKARRDGGGQGAAGAVGILGGDARRCQHDDGWLRNNKTLWLWVPAFAGTTIQLNKTGGNDGSVHGRGRH